MANARELIRMSDKEIAAFLDGPHKLQLASINPDGTPHLVTMYYAMFDGRIGFWTYRRSQKARNLERDARVTCLVETGEGYDQLRGVQVRGRVDRIDEPGAVLDVGTAVYGRYMPGMAALAPYLEQQALKRAAFFVTPERIASWDHRKLATVAAG